MLLDGKPINPATDYRVTVSDFLSNGGDGFAGFAQGRDRVRGISDLDALEAWLKGPAVRKVPEESRVVARP